MVLSSDEVACNAQIRKLSVKRITSPLVYDNLKNAVPNGLYDAAMGPMETHDRWAAFAHRYACAYGSRGLHFYITMRTCDVPRRAVI